MQALTGFLVEYLILGSGMACALLLGLRAYGVKLDYLDPEIVLIFTPLLYVLGMFSDNVGYFIVRWAKRRIVLKTLKKHNRTESKYSAIELYTYLSEICPNIYRIVQTRSARDRVARGMLANIIFIFIALLYFVFRSEAANIRCVLFISLFGFILFVLVFCIWWRLQSHSSTYEFYAGEFLEKNKGIDPFKKK